MFNKLLLFTLTVLFISASVFITNKDSFAQDIPELHMLVLQGDIFVSGSQNSDLDGLMLTAKIGGTIVGSTKISNQTSTSRYVALEIGPDAELEGKDIQFSIGNQVAVESIPFGPTTPSGTFCRGCSWVLPLSKTFTVLNQSLVDPKNIA